MGNDPLFIIHLTSFAPSQKAHILIFLSTHSDRERGDLYVEVTGQEEISAEVSQVSAALDFNASQLNWL